MIVRGPGRRPHLVRGRVATATVEADIETGCVRLCIALQDGERLLVTMNAEEADGMAGPLLAAADQVREALTK